MLYYICEVYIFDGHLVPCQVERVLMAVSDSGVCTVTFPRPLTLAACDDAPIAGRVFTAEELIRVGEFCVRHDLIIVSDEVHCDLILDQELEHISMLALDGGVRLVNVCVHLVDVGGEGFEHHRFSSDVAYAAGFPLSPLLRGNRRNSANTFVNAFGYLHERSGLRE